MASEPKSAAEWLDTTADRAKKCVEWSEGCEECECALRLIAMLRDTKAELEQPYWCPDCGGRAFLPASTVCAVAGFAHRWRLSDGWNAIERKFREGGYR